MACNWELTGLFLLGMVGGTLSGLLGLGGGIIMLPLLVTFPQLAGIAIGLREAAGITMLQSLMGSLSGLLFHCKCRTVDHRLALTAGASAAVGSLGGALFSKMASEQLIAGLFALMAVTSLALLLLPHDVKEGDAAPVSYGYAPVLGGGVGLLAGIVGQGGAFLLLPLMVRFLKVPLRTAIGTTTGIAFLSALAGFIGKWGTGQVPLLWALAVSLGAIAGGGIGGAANQRLSTKVLQRILIAIVAASAVRVLLLAAR